MIIRKTVRDILSKWYSTPWDFVLIPPGASMMVKNQRKHVVISVQGQNSRISVVRGEEKTHYMLRPRQWDTVELGEIVQNMSRNIIC